jgi:hypothetical protein
MSVSLTDQGAALANDDARPLPPAADGPADQPDQLPAAPAAADDPDLAELQAARAELAAAEAGQQEPNDTPQQRAAAPPAPAGGQQQPPRAPKHVPYDRFVQAARENATLRERNAYLEGALAARAGGAPAAPGQQPPAATPPAPAPAPTTDSQIQALRQQQKDAARRFDVGEITMAEFEEIRATAEDRIAALRDQQRAPAASDSLADQAIETAHLNRLYGAHPYARNLTVQQAEFLAELATMELAGEGAPIRDGSKAESLRLRERIALLSDTWGPKWKVQPSSQQPTGQQPTQPRQPPMSPTAAARQAKMTMAAGLPPDLSQFGAGGTAEISVSQIEAMDDEAIAALPAAVRARVLPSTA